MKSKNLIKYTVGGGHRRRDFDHDPAELYAKQNRYRGNVNDSSISVKALNSDASKRTFMPSEHFS